jgi:hypothetical protein
MTVKTVPASVGRTEFQRTYMERIINQPLVEHIVSPVTCDIEYRGPFLFLYYTDDGSLHCDRIGVNKLLHSNTHTAMKFKWDMFNYL